MKYCYFFLLIIAAISCSEKNTDGLSELISNKNENQTIAVETLTVSKGKLLPYITASGLVKGANEAWAVSETQGIILNSYVSLGDRVNKNDIIAKIESDIQKLNMNLAKQNLESLRLDYNGNKKSYESGNISRSQYDKIKYQLLLAENQYKIAKRNYDLTSIRVPIKGLVAVIDSDLTPGNYLFPGTKILKIIDISSYKVELYLGEGQISSIEVGAKAEITVTRDFTTYKYQGEVTSVGAGSDLNTGSFPVIVEWQDIPENSTLKSGISAKVKIETRKDLSEIIIPTSSIIPKNKSNFVFLNIDNKVTKREIEVTRNFGGMSVLSNGLSLGDELIISRLSNIKEGDKITTTNRGLSRDWQ